MTMDAPEQRPRPRAFRLDPNPPAQEQPGELRTASGAIVTATPDVFAAAEETASETERAIEKAQKRGILQRSFFSWGGLFWSAMTGLLGIAISVWFSSLIENLFARSAALGWIGVALAALAALALLALAAREMRAVLRQKHIAHLHIAFAQAHAKDDGEAARKSVQELMALYSARPDTARGRDIITRASTEIIDGRDFIEIAERNLMSDLDAMARGEIAAAAKRVSVVTAIAPRAFVDVIFVAGQAVRLIRRIAEIYGGRPGLMGFVKLARSVGAHLAITAGMAVGDSIVQQILGHGVAAKLSARLGEGVLNGMLTARIGLSAMAVCRPMPFAALKQPGVADVAPALFADRKGKASAEEG